MTAIDHYQPEKYLTLINPELIQRYRVMPLAKTADTLTLGTVDPSDQSAINAIMFHTGLRVTPVPITQAQLNHFIASHCQTDIADHSDEPLIKFVDHILTHALQKSASDIHIEPYEHHCRIRYRQDGVLYKITEIANALAERLAVRLKVLSGLDISERRLPQDGRFQFQQTPIRMSTCPTVFGEKIVLRILDARKVAWEISSLGFTPAQQTLFLEKIAAPQGMILVTGPTGSGKTVTLYSALSYLNTLEKNISTVEDPVEIQLHGVNQVNVNPKIGLHFATALRTFLRQDPDIIMVGEIRDMETATIAIQAAQTGHLVLSTLHTNSALATLTRLHAMGVEPYNLIHSLSLIIAQRLIRKLCEHCKQVDDECNYRAHGCARCWHGYHGRIAIYEVLPLTESLAQLLIADTDTKLLAAHLQQQGFKNLYQMGLEAVAKGITSRAEINRVIQYNEHQDEDR